MKNVKRAFTLVEIMIVVLIIGILLAIAVPNFIRAREQSRAKSCSANLKQVDAAKEQFAMDAKKNAGETVAWADLVSTGTTGGGATGYLKATPECPSAGSYTIGGVSIDPTCNKTSTAYPHTVDGR